MFQRDYISRVIEEMSQIPAKVLGYRLEHKLELANLTIEDYYRTYLKTDRSAAVIPDAAKLMEIYQMDFGQLEPFSALLVEEAELFLAEGNEKQAKIVLIKAIEILTYVNDKEKVNYSQDRIVRLYSIKKRIAAYPEQYPFGE
jgi:hypothetical protein